MEPLLSLREAAVAGQLDRVELTADTVTLADRTYPRDTPTSWKTGTDTFYTLATLITFLQHGHKPLPEYMASMRAAKVDRVGFDAREDLRSYFSGKIDSHPNIQQSVPSLDLAQASQGDAAVPAEPGQPDSAAGAATEAQAAANKLAALLACERQLRDRNSQLEAPGVNFTPLLALIEQADNRMISKQPGSHPKANTPGSASKRPRDHTTPTSRTPGAPPPPPGDPGSAKRHRSDGRHREAAGRDGQPKKVSEDQHMRDKTQGKPPIIIVPAASSARINLYNAKALLEECRYMTPEEGRASGVAKQSLILIRRTMGRSQEVLYHVTDQPPPPKDSAWYRVAAIFVTGASWQFKDYPLEGVPVKVLSHFLGLYLGFSDDPAPENVKNWNVKSFQMSRNNRHRDRSVVQDIYAAIDRFLTSRKSLLKF